MNSSLLHRFGAIVLLLTLSVITLAQSKGFDLNYMDAAASACDNFYRYAVGGWLKNNEIPPAYSSWGVDHMVEKRNFDILREVLETATKDKNAQKGSDARLIGDFYATCMDEAAIEKADAKPIESYFKLIDSIKNQRDLQTAIARLHKQGFRTLFSFFADSDIKNSSQVIANVNQSGLSLPNRDYYTKTDEKSKQLREQFTAHIARMFELLGKDSIKAKADADTIMKIEMRLANVSKTPVEMRDPLNRYNKMKLAEAQVMTPNISWKAYATELGAPQFTEINLGQPEFFKDVNRMMSEIHLSEWKIYLRWKVLTASAPSLSKRFDEENFKFYSATLRGTKEQLPRWRRCLVATDSMLGEALGQEYVKRAFTPEAKQRMNELVDNLFTAYRERLSNIDWMSETTRKQALAKLATFQRKVGYPDKLRGYKGLNLSRTSYLENLTNANQFQIVRDLQDIGKPVDRTRWGMTPPTINAYYESTLNEIVFPAGILQPPFFNVAADDALNYGAIGGVIGHEITHGFDDEGSKFDAQGNFNMWWTPEDRKRFEDKADCVIKQYESYEVDKDLFMNGKLTLGENIADLGGLIIAYNAFKKSLEGKTRPANIDGFTPEQRFFLGYALSWMMKRRPEQIRLQVQTDTHAIEEYRVLGPLSNMPEFAEAFQCKIGDKMVRDNRCQVW